MEKLTEIATGFRNIRLVYNQKKELSDFEIELLEKYQQLHHQVQEFSNQVELMNRYSLELIPLLKETKPRFEALEIFQKEIMSFHNMKIAENDALQIQKLERKIEGYNLKNKELLDLIITLRDKYDLAWDLQNKIIETDENLDPFFESFRNLTTELYRNYKNYEIDIVQFDHDEQEFLGLLGDVTKRWNKLYSDFTNITNDYSAFATRYNEFMEFVEKNKHITPIMVPLPEAPVPGFINQKQFYIQPDNPKITQYTNILDVAATEGKGINVSINLEETEQENLQRITDIIMVSQHKDTWIDNIVFKINLIIKNFSSSEDDIINPLENKKLLQLFQRLGKNPIIYFFLKNPDFGLMCLAGDIILKPGTELRKGYNTDDEDYFFTEIGFTADDLNIIFNRLFDGCIAFYQYCEDTTIDTRFYIESAIKTLLKNFNLKEYNIDISYQDVVDHCEKLKSLPYPIDKSLN